jgi:hypothetical protein
MKKIAINYLLAFLFFGGIAITFAQCDKDYVTPDMDASLDVRGNDYKNQQNPHNQENAYRGDLCTCLMEKYEFGELESAEINALLFMVEEEKLARDVYDFLYSKWDYKIFDRISSAEQRHMDAVSCLIEGFELANPIEEDVAGVFVNQNLAILYTELIDEGKASLEEAFQVGATIEDLDIADLIGLVANEEISNEALIAVFGELTKGSRNHLRAFIKNLDRVDAAYEPEFITQELFEEIIGSDIEKGSGLCVGLNDCAFTNSRHGQGNGPGSGDGTCDGSGAAERNNGNNNGNNNCSGNNNRNGTHSGTCDGSGSNGNSGKK